MTEFLRQPSVPSPRPVVTVLGEIGYDSMGITDAHNHVWIDAVPGARDGSPVLDQYDAILADLVEYRQAGGGALLDCQPAGFGRDGNKLRALSQASGVHVLACTGFHRRQYRPSFDALWTGTAESTADRFIADLSHGLEETIDSEPPVRAGFVKIALEAEWGSCAHNCIEAAAAAARQTNVVIEIHTEKGALAERALTHLMNLGLDSHQLVLCHMDKRPDFNLHRALAETGVLLEYDTFHRAKYSPEQNLWPLLEKMAAAGHADRIALATDMAEASQYRNIGAGPGLASLPDQIRTQLRRRGFSQLDQQQLLGGNIARRLAGLV